jgi:hypothetical protein
MSSRWWMPSIVALAAVLHAIGMARAPLPAQDGLKFLRFAREFQERPWVDVVRSADQHPLYPALVAVAEPIVAIVSGPTPDSWRIAGQLVSVVAALLMLWPLHAITRRLFDETTANLAVLLYVLLPFPAAIGRDTLADSLALCLTVAAMALGEATLRTRSWWSALGCGAAAGLGFLARPEVALVPPVVALAGVLRWRGWADEWATTLRMALMAVVAGGFIGGYALVKGELSEKLSLRWSTAIGVDNHLPKKPPLVLPRGLDNPRFDFSPKEESLEPSLRSQPVHAAGRLAREWAEGFSYVLIPVLVWGLIRGRSSETSPDARRILVVYAVAFAFIAIRHASTLGYLSGRHALTLVVAALPWAAAGTMSWVSGFPERRGLSLAQGRRLGYAGLMILATVGIGAQLKARHPSRWGYRAAGLWLLEKAEPGEKVLDTRGWASFVRGVPGYDYWHVKQALSDRELAYVVVGTDELNANSRRAATLRALLAYAGKPVAGFPVREGGRDVGVQVYHFSPPRSWEGIRP